MITICTECGRECVPRRIQRHWSKEYGFEEQYSLSRCCDAEIEESDVEKEMEE